MYRGFPNIQTLLQKRSLRLILRLKVRTFLKHNSLTYLLKKTRCFNPRPSDWIAFNIRNSKLVIGLEVKRGAKRRLAVIHSGKHLLTE